MFDLKLVWFGHADERKAHRFFVEQGLPPYTTTLSAFWCRA